MDDYVEQQQMEVEALESIFMDDLQEVTDSVPSGWRPQGKVYRLVLTPQLEEDLPDEYPLRAELVFAHTPSYPDDAPLAKALGVRGMADADVAALQGVVDEQVEANMGMPMIYALVTAAQEWINERGAAMAVPTADPEAERKREQAAEEARIAALRAHGTPVTPETFAAWQAKFEAEAALAKASLLEAAAATATAAAGGKPKLTGKQWFMQQEAQHIEIEEPELAEDEEDGGSWSGRSEGGGGEAEEEEEISEDSEDDELLDELLAAKAGGT